MHMHEPLVMAPLGAFEDLPAFDATPLQLSPAGRLEVPPRLLLPYEAVSACKPLVEAFMAAHYERFIESDQYTLSAVRECFVGIGQKDGGSESEVPQKLEPLVPSTDDPTGPSQLYAMGLLGTVVAMNGKAPKLSPHAHHAWCPCLLKFTWPSIHTCQGSTAHASS